MKFNVISAAILALPAALAAVAADYNASPTHHIATLARATSTPKAELHFNAFEHNRQALRLQQRDSKTTASSSSSTSAPPPAGVTEIAVFTAEGIPYTITSLDGTDRIDGKTLVPGGASQLIAGADVVESPNGVVYVNGATATFMTASSSSSPSHAAAASSSAAAASSSSSGGAALPTGAVGAGAVVLGAVVLIL